MTLIELIHTLNTIASKNKLTSDTQVNVCVMVEGTHIHTSLAGVLVSDKEVVHALSNEAILEVRKCPHSKLLAG